MVNAILSVFPDARVSSGYVRVRCPYHKNGNERRPSMSILLEAKGDMPAGTCHCFACGKVVTLDEMFEYVGAKEAAELAKPVDLPRKAISLNTDYVMYKPQLPHRYSCYLSSRGIGETVQKLFKVYEKENKIYMPVFDRDGKYLYVNARSTEGKKYFVETGAQKTLWGIEEIDLSRPIVVCEGQIDAMTFWELGYQAVATLGVDNIKSLKEIEGATSIIVLAFDNDPAGHKATERAADFLGRFRCRYVQLPSGEDINDLLVKVKDKEKLSRYIEDSTLSMKEYVH